jgi:hypothetical protein
LLLLLLLLVPAPVATDDDDDGDDDDDDDDDDNNNNLCRTSGCLRNKKYTQSKSTLSSMAAVTNASTITHGPVVLLSSSERR